MILQTIAVAAMMAAAATTTATLGPMLAELIQLDSLVYS